jgi:hypothetical protein
MTLNSGGHRYGVGELVVAVRWRSGGPLVGGDGSVGLAYGVTHQERQGGQAE